jgi:hypothetical protein
VQIGFYSASKNWKYYVKYVNLKIKKYPPQKKGKLFGGQFGDAWLLNSYAWTLFLNSSDKRILKKGLTWINLSCQLEESTYNLDTKANLLYRIGKVKEAVSLAEKAVMISKNDKSIVETLEKMKAGLPTWIVPGDQKQ